MKTPMAITEDLNQTKANEALLPESNPNSNSSPSPSHFQETVGSKKRSGGVIKILSLSGVAMALALPIGIYPRLLQAQELEQGHVQIEEKLPTVSVSHLTATPATRQISLPGTVEALQETAIYARTDGYIKQRRVDIGDRVKAGQILADIETPEVDESAKESRALVLTSIATKAQVQANLDKARADLDSAMADLAQAKSNLMERQSNEKFSNVSNQRWKKLVEEGAVSSHDSDEKENAFKMSMAATQAAKDRIRSLQSQIIAARARVDAEVANLDVGDANIEAAQARQNRTKTQQNFKNVTAPFAGVITERNIDNGMLITGGSENSKQSLYRIARIDTVKVFVEVPQYAANGIKVGQNVSVVLKEFPGRTFIGKVLRTSVALDASARTLKTEIHIPNPDLTLTPGMYADVSFAVPRTTRTYMIPTNALVTRGDGPQVVLASNNAIEYRSVKLGDDFGKEVEILNGLKGNEEIVINPSDALKDGAKVTIDK